MPTNTRVRLAQRAIALIAALLLPGCASRRADADAASREATRRCPDAAELRVTNRSNTLAEVVEYDETTGTTKVIGVADPGVSHFPARGEAEITYVLRRVGGGWLASDRTAESSHTIYAVERRCR